MNHVLSDMIVRIRNASRAKQFYVEVYNTKMAQSLAQILLAEGFIQDVRNSHNDSHLVLELKYIGKTACFTDAKILSTPGVRMYAGVKNIPKVLGGLGVVVLSTSQGIITDKKARALHIGGELLCSIW